MPIRKKIQDSNESTIPPKRELINQLIKKRPKSKFLTENQKIYYETLLNNQITICSGPAGVGKSYIAMKTAVDLLLDESNGYDKIIIVRPAVDAEEKLEAREKLKDTEIIEVFALAYMRGMTIDNSILIFEEAQNATPKQMKLLLTRIGANTKFFISGDIEQTDRYKDKTHSGLYDALTRFNGISGIGIFEFGDKDGVRNPIITKILRRYEEDRN